MGVMSKVISPKIAIPLVVVYGILTISFFMAMGNAIDNKGDGQLVFITRSENALNAIDEGTDPQADSESEIALEEE